MQRFPKPLRSGDRLAVVAPSSPVMGEDLAAGGQIWRDRGFDLVGAANVGRQWGYLAGTDAERVQAWQEVWADPAVVGVVGGRGGYGALRLLPHLAWEAPPKWVVGYSDLTALQWALAARGWGSLHGPVLKDLPGQPPAAIDALFGWLQGSLPSLTLTGQGLVTGQATGWLLPGNLTVATHLLGTPFCPSLAGAILALEDVNELPYQVDRLLTHWRLSGAWAGIRGIALGRFSGEAPSQPSLTWAEVWSDRLGDLGVPVVTDLPFGHGGLNLPLPVGAIATLDGNQGTLVVQSPLVC
ncbi:MAG: S66 peptidase family protein [Pseudanabaenaceae cyanobacterium]